ncbi:hypothetical protein LCGC14_1227520, partial [marine sediment metagenome]
MTDPENIKHNDDQKSLDLNIFHESIASGIMKGLWTTNKNDVIQYTNKGMEKIAGISSDKIIGTPVLKDFPKSTLKYFRPYYLKAKRNLRPILYDSIPVLTQAGRKSYQSGWLIPKIKDGSFDGMICTVDDITERKRIEKKLKKSEYKLKERVKELNCLYELSKLIEKSDISIEEVIEKALNLIPPAWQFPDITCARIIYGEKEFKTENFVKTKWVMSANILKGEKTVGALEVYYLKKMPKFDGSLFLKEEGHLINAFVEILGGFFERKKVELSIKRMNVELEQKIKERTKELIQSQKRYKELFNNMSSGVAVYEAIKNGEDFVFKDFNLAGERIDSIRKEDILGKKVTEIFSGVKEFGLFQIFQRVWKTGKPEHTPISQYKDNRIIGWRETYVYKLPSGEIVAVYNDITEIMVAQNKLKESEEKFRAITEQSLIGIAILQNDRFKYVNKQFADIYGYTPKEMINWEKFEYAKLVHLDDKEMVLEQAKKKQLGVPGVITQYQ